MAQRSSFLGLIITRVWVLGKGGATKREVGCKEVWDTRGKGKEKRKTTLVITFFERGDYFKQAVRDK